MRIELGCFLRAYALLQASSSSRSAAEARWEEFRNNAVNEGAKYFQEQDVFHIKCHEDTTLKPTRRWLEQIPDLVASCLRQWKIVCNQLWKQSMLVVMEDKSMRVLFHCFGGINRSAEVLCASLVVAYEHSALEAVQLLLQKRPALRRCVLGAIDPMSWKRCGTWKVCARNGRETSAQHTETSLCRRSSVETVRDETATSSLRRRDPQLPEKGT